MGWFIALPPYGIQWARALLANDRPSLCTMTEEDDGLVSTRNDQGEGGMSAMVTTIDANEADAHQELTEGFHLVIDALKLNGINTVYCVPGIPITGLSRMPHAAAIRVSSFRTEHNAGSAA